MRVTWSDEPDDNPPTWQSYLFGHPWERDHLVKQRPFFDGGMDRGRPAPKPVDGPGLFEGIEGESEPPAPAG